MATCIERLKRLVQDIDEAVSQMDIPPAFSLFWKRDMFARLILSRFLMYCGAMQMFEGAKNLKNFELPSTHPSLPPSIYTDGGVFKCVSQVTTLLNVSEKFAMRE
mmetsp:Transcript_31191/g.81837  ORF Transcript_31191/g.81837 Transcript_31191/m.81837 type:complete len:105 (+) Transcript_31191:86-400(+)